MGNFNCTANKFILSHTALQTVKSLAHMCSSTISTRFTGPILWQTHIARQRQIKSQEYPVTFLGQS